MISLQLAPFLLLISTVPSSIASVHGEDRFLPPLNNQGSYHVTLNCPTTPHFCTYFCIYDPESKDVSTRKMEEKCTNSSTLSFSKVLEFESDYSNTHRRTYQPKLVLLHTCTHDHLENGLMFNLTIVEPFHLPYIFSESVVVDLGTELLISNHDVSFFLPFFILICIPLFAALLFCLGIFLIHKKRGTPYIVVEAETTV